MVLWGYQPLGNCFSLGNRVRLPQPRNLAEDSLYDSESIRRFVRIELGEDVVPDETTILRFRHLLETHGLTAQIFEQVKELLSAK